MSGRDRRLDNPGGDRIDELVAALTCKPDPIEHASMYVEHLADRGWTAEEIRRGDFDEDFDPHDVEGFLASHQDEADQFSEWLARWALPRVQNQYALPASCHLERIGRVLGDPWLVHFTSRSRALAIKRLGFLHGEPEPDRLAFTRLRGELGPPGWNFAFMAGRTGDAGRHAVAGDYGTSAVLLRAPAVAFRHRHDREWQAVFWGPDVRCVAVAHRGRDGWRVGRGLAMPWDELVARLYAASSDEVDRLMSCRSTPRVERAGKAKDR